MLLSDLEPVTHAVFILGVALLVIGLIWRGAAIAAGRVRLAQALTAPDAATRTSAIEIAASHGLDRHARALLKVVEADADPHVLDALAHAVVRNTWEPADNPRTVELRLWAERRRAGDSAPECGRPPSRSTATHRVLVTGAGGPAGVNVIRALIERGHHVVAVDTDPLAAGLHLAPEGDLIVPADDPSFVDRLLATVRNKGAEVVISTIAEEMLVLAGRRDEIAERVSIWLPRPEAIEACLDKWRFACAMSAAGIPVPPTAEAPSPDVPGPWVVKPRRSRGSRGVVFADDRAGLDAALRCTDDPIVQTRMRGREFTVDALVSRDGELVGAVPRWRLETKAGISTKGRTFSDDRVLDGVIGVLSTIGLDGAANVQGFVDGDDVAFLEVNPRFSGGLSLSLAAGADLVGEYLRGVLGREVRPESLAFRPDTTMIRHFEEIYA